MKKRSNQTVSIALDRQPDTDRIYRMNFFALALAILTILVVAATSASAQSTEQPTSAQPQSQPPNVQRKEDVGPNADTIKPYKPSGRDPFKKAVKPRAKDGKPKGPREVGFPSLDQRRTEFRQKIEVARSRDLPEPNPVGQYLVSELEVTGVFRDEHGTGAFVKAQPTGTMFFVRRGTPCYNGEVLRIETEEGDTGGAKVLFREISYVENNGKQSPQERVVGKAPGTSK